MTCMEKFDYNAAVGELERIEAKVQDPSTPLDETGALLERSKELVGACRKYLRSVRDGLDET